jgi:hypothetical protein
VASSSSLSFTGKNIRLNGLTGFGLFDAILKMDQQLETVFV